MERNVWIPRNLVEQDSIKFALGIRIRPSDVLAMSISAGAITPFISGLNDFNKYCAYFISIVFAYFIAHINYRRQCLPELFLNGIIYGCRKRGYMRRKKK